MEIKTAMISQPMRGKNLNELEKVRNNAVERLEKNGYRVEDTYFKEGYGPNTPLFCLGRALIHMSYCDAVYFCKGWEEARGCRIEHEAAEQYGLDILYEED